MSINIDKQTPGLWRVGLDNPPLNLMDPDLFADLHAFLSAAESADDLRVVVVESLLPDYFLAHLDIDRAMEIAPLPGGVSIIEAWHDFMARFAAARFATIASIRGRARGIGNEFLLAFDMRFASRERAILAQPEIGANVVPGGGGMDWLPRLAGRSRALEIMLSGDDYDADVAERYGWVNRALPDGELDGFVDRLARRIARWDVGSIAEIKKHVNARTPPAGAGEIQASAAAIGRLWQRPQALERIAAMAALGNNAPGEFEMWQPYFMGMLAELQVAEEASA